MATASPNLLLGQLRKLVAVGAFNKLSDAELLRRFAAERDQTAFEVLLQ